MGLLLRLLVGPTAALRSAERKTLAEIDKKLGRQALEEVTTIAKPDTILVWHRKVAPQQGDSFQPRQSVRRPHLDKAEAETEIQPDSMANDLPREPMMFVRIGRGSGRHGSSTPEHGREQSACSSPEELLEEHEYAMAG